MNTKRTFLLALPVLLSAAAAGAGDWAPFTALPEPRLVAGAAALNGTPYVVGGSTSSGLQSVVAWDAAAGAWASMSPLLHERQYLGVEANSGFIYAVGGADAAFNVTATAERYDAASNSWVDIAPMPSPRLAMGFAGLIVAGGMGAAGDMPAECFRYDASSNSWMSIASLQRPRMAPAAALMNGRVFLMGGTLDLTTGLNWVDVYDPGANSWTPGPALPEALFFSSCACFDGRIWVMGGMDGSGMKSNRVYSLGPDLAWRAENALPEMLLASAAVANGNQLFVAGGQDASGQPTDAVYLQTTTTPPPPPPGASVTVTLSPPVLDRASEGQWIMATVESQQWSVADIVVSSIRLGGVAVDPAAPVTLGDSNLNGVLDLQVKFPRSSFITLPTGEQTLAFEAQRTDASPVVGSAALFVQGTDNAAGKKKKITVLQVTSSAAKGTIVFSLSEDTNLTMEVMDLQGRVLDRIDEPFLAAGEYRREWPAGDRGIRSGIYFVRIRAAGSEARVRLALKN